METGRILGRILALVCLMLQHAHALNVVEDINFWNTQAQDSLKAALNVKPNTNVAKNVILFIGDGMGLNTLVPARIYKGQKAGNLGEETRLEWEDWPDIALSRTYNVDRQVPDSAGTATAYLCGVKTKYGTVGMGPDVVRGDCSTAAGNELTSILDWSQDEGKSVGVVTTTRVTHASPANTYAHSAERYWESDNQLFPDARGKCRDVAAQLIDDNPDINVVFGGGRSYFTPNGTYRDPEYPEKTGFRVDGRNLIEEWQAKKQQEGRKYKYAWNKATFDAIDPSETDYAFGLFEPGHMKYILDRDDPADEPTLAELTEKAIKILQKNDKGFFLFVEGGRVDHGHHAGQARDALEETIGLEEAVIAARRMLSEEDTLMILSADHSHAFAMGGYPSRGNDILGVVDPIGYATEPALDGKPYLTLMYTAGPGDQNRGDLTGVDTRHKDFKQQVAVQVLEDTHGGEDVAIYAIGPMSHLFYGNHEQNYIAHAMAYASCVGTNKDHCDCGNTTCGASIPMSTLWSLLAAVIAYLYISKKN